MTVLNKTSLLIAMLALAAAALFAPAGGPLNAETAADLGAALLDPPRDPIGALTELAREAAWNARQALAVIGLPWCF